MNNESLDPMVFGYQGIWNANKQVEYRERVSRNIGVMLRFLIDNDLLLIDPFDESGAIKPDLQIFKSNLTTEGFEMFRKVIPGWFGYLDKGGKVENISRLEKGLAKLREQENP